VFSLNAEYIKDKFRMSAAKSKMPYNKIIDWLIDNKFMVLKKKHVKDVSCAEYIFTDVCFRKDEEYILKDQFIINMMNRYPKRKLPELALERQWQVDVMKRLTIDQFTKNILFNTLLSEEVINKKNAIKCEEEKDNKDFDPDLLYTYKQYRVLVNHVLDSIIFGDIRYTDDNKSHRLYTTLTNLMKEFRSCLRLDGEELVNLDIANSQPAIVANLCRPIFRSKFQKVLKELLGADFKYPDEADCKAFIDLAISGELYEDIQEKMNITREEAKKYNMVFFFGPAFRKNNPAYDYLEEYHPAVFNFIKRIKTLLKGYNAYKRFAILCQRLESEIVLSRVGKELFKAGIQFMTIHDSFLVKESDKTKARVIIGSVFDRDDIKLTIKEE